mmetsp:Transcript_9571/g.25841  ORF Transcript_9571/g.25841 Transcript_9571/m.25841 type:complete len:123 (-) Transcript_9571:49-417(-)
MTAPTRKTRSDSDTALYNTVLASKHRWPNPSMQLLHFYAMASPPPRPGSCREMQPFLGCFHALARVQPIICRAGGRQLRHAAPSAAPRCCLPAPSPSTSAQQQRDSLRMQAKPSQKKTLPVL